MEIWKPIKGYENLYEVSNFGEVRSKEKYTEGKRHRKLKPKILKKYENSFGYLRVSLSKDGIAKDVRVHRLVALTFIKNPDNKPFINHKDGNPKNNSVENLEWCTQKENIQHAYKTGLVKRHDKLNIEGCDEYILKHYKRYSRDSNFRTIAEKFGVNWATILRRYKQLVKDQKYVNKFANW